MHQLLASCLVSVLAATSQAQWDPHVINGQVIVHLFEWRWSDIAAECENFLGPRGYGGVQVSPVNENVVVFQEEKSRPWWERYQPVSYKVFTRSGDEDAFKDMVNRCNKVGVRIYVDAVINHMTGWWPEGTGATGGTSFDAGSESYPGVSYSGFDFNDANCHTASGNIENYGDAIQVRNCKLVGLNDLNQGKDYVRSKIRDYLNKLLSWGVAGFRIDASKHMWPEDMKLIFNNLSDLNTEYYGPGERPFIYQEVIDQGECTVMMLIVILIYISINQSTVLVSEETCPKLLNFLVLKEFFNSEGIEGIIKVERLKVNGDLKITIAKYGQFLQLPQFTDINGGKDCPPGGQLEAVNELPP
ncbi:alpha-amylase 1-like [Homarus americanus]|uniref:alpha-amylase 1-like n=1 Tax=Homarus americanus TaxID=6706 RepID=UPI001C45CA08|nr:alpha-amylase 1-like [Homarus americanus]